jgi:phenylalanyl-tRNA synthetase beta chain
MKSVADNANFNRTFKDLPKFPATQRDIAMLVKDEVIVKDIEDVIKEKGGKLLEEVKLFDVYKGTQIKDGYKSVAYTITFRADHTLTDDEVNAPVNKILKSLKETLSAELREK